MSEFFSVGSRSIRFKYDMSDFEKNVQKFVNDAVNETRDILVKTTPSFVTTALRYTPPNLGTYVIERRFYYRPILNLIKLVRGEYHGYYGTKEDAYELKYNKMKFKVLNTKKGVRKNTAFGYARSVAEAKKMSRIANRGLSRVMWGTDLPSIGAKVPVSLARLVSKSPNVIKYPLNNVTLYSKNDTQGVEIVNAVKGIERYAYQAELKGYNRMYQVLMKELKNIADRNVTL